MKILIVGIPGTGKTTVGDYLHKKLGYIHIDMESGNNIPKAWGKPDSFISRLDSVSENLVVSWGFVPNERFINLINQLKSKDFKVIWFDGNREFAKRAFIERNKKNGHEFLEKSMDDLQVQMGRINDSDVITKINPKIVDTFKPDGSFRLLDDIVKDVLD